MAVDQHRGSEDAGIPAAARAAWEVMLVDAAVDGGPSGGGTIRSAARLTASLSRRPGSLIRRGRTLSGELLSIAAGRSERLPSTADCRFADPAWQGNPLFRTMLQTYLALSDTMSGLIDDADFDWATERRARFAAANALDALAPSNFPLTNPAVIKETLDHGGANLVRGARRFARDIAKPPRLPATVDTTRFTVGENLAVTPGRVVLRTEVFELIQYLPSTPKVREQLTGPRSRSTTSERVVDVTAGKVALSPGRRRSAALSRSGSSPHARAESSPRLPSPILQPAGAWPGGSPP